MYSSVAAASERHEDMNAIALGTWALRDATKDEEAETKRQLTSAKSVLRDCIEACAEAQKKVEEGQAVVRETHEQQSLDEQKAVEVADALLALARMAGDDSVQVRRFDDV